VTSTATPIRVPLLVLAYFAFISLGLPDGLLGVGWPSISSGFKVSTESVGLLLFAGTAGYLTSSVVAGFTIARLGVGWLLGASTAMAGLALAGYALSPAFWVMVPCGLLAGFGGGAIDAGLNAYAATAFGPRHMNWLHAFFGLGVAIGPVIMTSVLGTGASWRWGYAIVASAQMCLAAAFLVSARAWGARPEPEADADRPPPAVTRTRDTLLIPAVWLGVLAFGVYVAIEVGAGLWAFLLLTKGRAVPDEIAGLCVSGYWAALFVGRIVQGFVAVRLGPGRVLVGSLVGMAVGSLLVALPGPGWLAAIGLFLVGFAAAPVFPLLTLTTGERVGSAHADRAIGMQIAGAGLGGAVIPAGIGVLLSRVDVEALGPALLALSVLLIVLYALVNRPRASPAHG
jgi:fucose permease